MAMIVKAWIKPAFRGDSKGVRRPGLPPSGGAL